MSMHDAVAYALTSSSTEAAPGEHASDSSSSSGASDPSPLSPREYEIATRIADGLTNRQIAARLHISERTVDAHLRNIMGKLDVRSRAQVATWVSGHGVTRPR
jgi:DNA-binding NarL/FixJ family response regulator